MLHTTSLKDSNRHCRGFTLVELLVTIAIVAILAALAAPSFQNLIIDTRVSTQASEFLTMLNFTRSEAVKRNTRVTMCKSSNGTACATTGNWEQGWIVFVDGSIAGTLDGTDTVLRAHDTLSNDSTLVGNIDVDDYISFAPNGQSRTAANGMQGGTIKLCSSTTRPGRNIVLSTGPGRLRIDAVYPSCP